MSWTRMLLLGDVGQQLTIHDVESDITRLRAQLHRQHSTDRAQDDELGTLRREVTDLQLIVVELSRLLIASGAVPVDAVEGIVRGLDRADALAANDGNG